MNKKPVVYVQDSDYGSADRAIENIFLRFPLDVKDRLVWVKPNMLGDFIPEMHATTHPAVIKAIVNKLRSLGAKVVVGDNSGIQIMVSDIVAAKRTGLLEASDGTFVNISKDVVYRKLGGGFDESIAVSKIVDDCDVFISAPKMKTHLQTLITGAVKNSYGFVVGNQKPALHMRHPDFNGFSALVSEIYNIRKPDLVIMDAVYAMEGDGPNSPRTRRLGKIFASDDGVALDHYMAKIMGMDPERVPLLKYCAERDIGSSDYELQGGAVEEIIEDFRLPRTYYKSGAGNSLVDSLIYKFIMGKKIAVNRRLCSRCKKCMNICPTGAITWDDGPVFNSKKCILCFCCKEICDKDAISFAKRYVYAQRALNAINKLKDRSAKKKRK